MSKADAVASKNNIKLIKAERAMMVLRIVFLFKPNYLLNFTIRNYLCQIILYKTN